MAENLDVFFVDDLIAVDVVKGSDAPLRALKGPWGLYGTGGELIANGMVISEDHSVIMKTSDVVGWTTDDLITVDGSDYYVRYIIPVEDGKLSVITTSKK